MQFGVYLDPSKSTSGQRFFSELHRVLAKETICLEEQPTAMLFNVSAPIKAIIVAKLRRQKVVLRIDGLYLDRLSKAFLDTFTWPLCQMFRVGLRYGWAHDAIAHVANFLNQNYAAFCRILLADLVIYQSRYAREVHQRYFLKKDSRIIVNGAPFQKEGTNDRAAKGDDTIRLVTVYDDWRPAKRVHDVVEFVRWVHESKNLPMQLIILGYTGKAPACVQPRLQTLIETSPYIKTLPRFASLSGDTQKALFDSDMYITFTYRDPCPNVVVEAMAHGLPVVGVKSGGVPDIVGDAGILLPERGERTFFTAWRYENDFPPIDYEEALSAVLKVKAEQELFRARVRERFQKDLDIQVVAERYASAIRSLINPQSETLSETKAMP